MAKLSCFLVPAAGLLKSFSLPLRPSLLTCQPQVSGTGQAIVSLSGQSSVFGATDLVRCLTGQFHDVETIVDNLVLSQRKVLLGASNVGSVHVHGLDVAALLLRKLGKTAVCVFWAVSVGNGFHRAAIQGS
jgi:hypothetical protein